MTASRARRLHLLVAVVATAALVLQTVLVLRGGRVLDETGAPPGLDVRLGRLVSYFTIQSNLLVAVTSWQLVADAKRDGDGWRALRLAAVVGITVTGLVHYVLLRPLLDLSGADWAADTLLHVVVPVLAVLVWLVAGPRPRIEWTTVSSALAWPVVWLAWTLAVGAATGWFPYPFLDSDESGAWTVVGSCVGITLLFLALFAGARALDRRLAPVPTRAVRDPARDETPEQRAAQ